ncbi:MAG: efflux RND transporter periplasmic adaptor subunit [candidate division KSB1 bacterium]|nr:efflux RND transporter periplasmic adaptor subunit [candidate division KSB1 bacterium]MDZ7336793.1 efflux RND transporter periplasmic adaptor subunit [candidate division KSB1 bacterium]MDZ7358392.1 efflux RND transporter periplasmic adaptor subunit [candidate division KSB1 bacterium]MDZ7400145.1 efflux RND transporter periplasmic adaptor subunit [candidate division KSB1 bacterium]
MSKKTLRSIILVLLLCAIFASSALFIVSKLKKNSTSLSNKTAEQSSQEGNIPEIVPVMVSAKPSHRGDLIIRVSASGQTEAIQQVTIMPKISGEIVELPIYEGKLVSSGDLLIKLDDREYQLALNDARQKLLKARSEYEVQKLDRKALDQLIDSSAINRSEQLEKQWKDALQRYHDGELDEASYQKIWLDYQSAQILRGVRHEEMVASRTGFSSALIDYERAQLNLSRCEIRAPFSGQIGDLSVRNGQFISAGKECCKLLNLSRLRVNVGVLESEVQHLAVGRKATIELPAFPSEKFEGNVITINPIIDPDHKTCRVTVEMPNPNNRIKAGMFAYVKIDAQIYHDRLLVPREAVLTRDQRTLIFAVQKNDEGKLLAKWNYVETGLENDEYIEILNTNFPFQAGDLVITSGHYTLAHDAEVKLINEGE